MALAAGSKLGPYEIVALIGAGGMGEVYHARDPRLNRDVAIKISAAQFTERFEREARAVAALNHPNICTLYDVGPNYLVMELVEGEAPKGPLPLEEALRIARQIAAALEEAHEKGITHRDLKPANIKIKPDGTVKVLDFGLAKITTAEGSDPENSPTLSMAATQMGMILGTAGYMSPEQARGKKADKRADIWAFGVVLYELLTGKRLFEGEDVSHIMAAVILQQPTLDDVPFEVRKLLRRCLEKDPKNRLRDIGDVWQLLDVEQGHALPATTQGTALRHSGLSYWVWTACAAVMLLALGAAGAWIFKPSLPLTITRFPVTVPEGQIFTTTSRTHLALSPDGTQIAYVANRRLYLRNMFELEPRAIPGTDLGGPIANPVFSPDGKTVAFDEGLDQTLKGIAVSGGAAVTICAAGGAGGTAGIAWGPDGIVFAQPGKGILKVSPNGGQPETLVTVKENEQVEGPQMLPGGQAVLFTLATGSTVTTAAWDKAQIVVQTLKSGARKTLISGGSDGRYLPTGHLVYALNGVLFAMAFDLKRLATIGGPVGIVEGIARGATGAAQFAFSNTGSLVYVPGPAAGLTSGRVILGLVDRRGEVEPLKAPPSAYYFPRVSRDGKRVAYQIDEGNGSSIWIYELSGASAPRRLTLPGTGINRDPIWSSDNQRVAFQSDREGDLGIWWQPADGNAPAERLTKPDKGVTHIPDSWSPDGQRFSFTSVKSEGSSVWIYSLRDKKAKVFAEIPGSSAGRSAFSPVDGRWVAYSVNEGGATHNFIKAYPAGATYPLPQDGSDHHPVWSPNQKEIFYVAGPDQFGSVSVNTQPSVSFGSPVRAPRAGFITQAFSSVRTYDILPDGQHFIGVVSAGTAQTGQAGAQIQVVLNWFEDVKQRAPGR